MLAWGVLLPILKYVLPLPTLARLAWRGGRGRARNHEHEAKISTLARLVATRSNCLERSLVAYRFLARASADPRLVVGLGRQEDRVRGHVWVTLDGNPLLESAETLREYTPIVSFGVRGAADVPSEL